MGLAGEICEFGLGGLREGVMRSGDDNASWTWRCRVLGDTLK
jgi:hypothetical protein